MLLNRLTTLNLHLQLGLELEFYLRYNDSLPSPEKIRQFSELMSVPLEEERGAGQFEVTIPHCPALEAIAKFTNLKMQLKIIATACRLTFVTQPKPFPNDYGSAIHANISLHDINGTNLMAPDVIVAHANSLLSLVNTDMDFICVENDIPRFQAGFMAPSHLAWGGNNRSTVIRIPDSVADNKRLEFRLPGADADINRVLLFVVVALTLAPYQTEKYPKIYGNAHDNQYNLPKLQFCNNIEQKKLASAAILHNYLQKLGI